MDCCQNDYSQFFAINKLTNPNRTLFCDKARNEVTRARKKCRVNTSRRQVLLPTLAFLFVLQYSFAHICKEIGLNLQENKFYSQLASACKKKFSACQRAQNGVMGTGYSMHLYSNKSRCFNQSEHALYQNFIIKLYRQ